MQTVILEVSSGPKRNPSFSLRVAQIAWTVESPSLETFKAQRDALLGHLLLQTLLSEGDQSSQSAQVHSSLSYCTIL